jgi:hypothetical protein
MRLPGAAIAALSLAACFYDETSPLPASFAVCEPPPAPTDAVPPIPTWYRDVQPIVVAKCQGCHVDGGIAPFALDGFADVTTFAESIHLAVTDRRMPPWQPDACCNTYRWDRSLTEDQRATFLRWLEQGFALGDPADAPPAEPPPPGLPRVDLRAVMPEPFSPQPQIGADELRCFLLDHDAIDRVRYITGFDFQPGVRSMVHHVIAYAVEADKVDDFERRSGSDGRPGFECRGDDGEVIGGKRHIGGWQPGVTARLYPDGMGRELPAGSRLMISVHYDTGHGIAPDLSAIDIMLEDRVDRIERNAGSGNPLWLVGEGMEIRAGDPDAMVWFSYDPTAVFNHGRAMDIHNVMVHMHELGSIGRIGIERADGTWECLLNIADWDFHWMADYYLDAPVHLEPGDKLYVECHWDNTAANQKIVNGVLQEPRTIGWGTDEEMCGAVVLFSEEVE